MVLYAHGTGGSYRSGVTEGLARALANVDLGGGTTAHVAPVGYDGVMHGPRRGAGVTESPNTLFFNFANPRPRATTCCRARPTCFALVRALETVTLPMLPDRGGHDARSTRARIFFLGHSQGATVGLPAVAFEPDLAGDGVLGRGRRSARVAHDQAPPGGHRVARAASRSRTRRPTRVTPRCNLFQAYFERSDAVNYGPRVLQTRPMGAPLRPVLMTYGWAIRTLRIPRCRRWPAPWQSRWQARSPAG